VTDRCAYVIHICEFVTDRCAYVIHICEFVTDRYAYAYRLGASSTDHPHSLSLSLSLSLSRFLSITHTHTSHTHAHTHTHTHMSDGTLWDGKDMYTAPPPPLPIANQDLLPFVALGVYSYFCFAVRLYVCCSLSICVLQLFMCVLLLACLNRYVCPFSLVPIRKCCLILL